MPEKTSLSELDAATHAEVFDQQTPRTVRLQLEADQRVPPHTHPGEDIVLHLLSGRLELTLADETLDVQPGELVQFSGDQEISPYAVEPSTAVLVFAPADSG